MIRRPLNPRFNSAVLEKRKFTTIRKERWPVGVPIMLYNWAGVPYRSKQIDVAVVVVGDFCNIQIEHADNGAMIYYHGMKTRAPLHQSEGFASWEEMDNWFRPLVKRGLFVTKVMMRFRLVNASSPGAPKP